MYNQLDLVMIGYNETPFSEYEELLRNYEEAHRDIQYSYVDLGEGRKLTYVGLLNHVYNLAYDRGPDAQDEFISGEIPNLAALYLTNSVLKKGMNAKYVNLFQYEKEKLVELLAQNPIAVGITTTFYGTNLPVVEVVEFIRQHNQHVKVIVGGPLIANHYRNYDEESFKFALEDIGADIYVIESQGEETLYNILQTLKAGGDLLAVPNLAYFQDDKLYMTLSMRENNSLEDNHIDWNLFSTQDLGPTLQTRTARSCAFNCSFCNYPTRAGKLTLTSLETIEKELDAMYALGYVKNVVFIDDTFNIPLERFKEICRLMIRKQYNFNWFSYFRCANADDEAIDLMAQSGCKGVFLGIESGSPTILKHMNKAVTIEKYREGIARLHANGILTFGSFIVGFPGETKETLQETINFLKETHLDYFRAQIWYCEPGTKIEKQRETYQIRGEGFVWSHATMNSSQAMDSLQELFQTIDGSNWLPQWSFDFWIIPYLIGKGLTFQQFHDYMRVANQLMGLHFVEVSEADRVSIVEEKLQQLIGMAKEWKIKSNMIRVW